jgi:hypothetical protein
MKRKGYLQTVKNDIGKPHRVHLTFAPTLESAAYYKSREHAETDCKVFEISQIEIGSNEGGSYLLHGFKVEEFKPDSFAVYCEGPFIVEEKQPE